MNSRGISPDILSSNQFKEKSLPYDNADYDVFFVSATEIPNREETVFVPSLKKVLLEDDKIVFERKYFSKEFWKTKLKFEEERERVKKKSMKKIKFPFEEVNNV